MASFFEQLEPSKILDNLKRKLYGRQNDKKIDSIDAALDNINKNILNKNTKNYSEIMQRMISNTISYDEVNNITADLISDIENQSRLTRYVNAEELCECIPYCERALQVLSDGVISTDDITKKTIQVLDGDNQSTSTSDADMAEIRNIINKLKIDEMLRSIVPETLRLGDHFVEICDYTSKDIPVTQSVLNEEDEFDGDYGDSEFLLEWEQVGANNEIERRPLNLKLEVVEANYTDISDTSREKFVELSNIRLIPHDPRNVVKLQSKRYKMCLGYLVMPSGESGPGININQFGVTASPTTMGRQPSGLSSLFPGQSSVVGIDGVYQTLMKKIKSHVTNSDIAVNRREILLLLMRAIREIEEESEQQNQDKGNQVTLSIRYVPVYRMQHFKLPSQKFFPYGESIFYKSTFQGKLLIALETAVTMKRISDSTEKRLIYFETGMSREGKNIVEELKNKFKKRKFSIDSIGTISSIPSQLTSFEDIYVPQSKGRRFMEFDTLNKSVDIRDTTEELKYVRDTIVAGLNVPPAYLSLEENLSNKAALTFENALFAQAIVSYQHILSKDLQDMVDKIYTFTKGKRIKEGATITFSPPKMLQMERDAEKYELSSRVINALVEFGVPKEWAVKNFIDLPWNDIEHSKSEEDLNKLEEPPSPDEMMGGAYGGGYGAVGGLPPSAY